MVVGNKVDVVREIEPEDIQDWVLHSLPQERYEKIIKNIFSILKYKLLDGHWSKYIGILDGHSRSGSYVRHFKAFKMVTR